MKLEKEYREIQRMLGRAAMSSSASDYRDLLEEVVTDCEGRLDALKTNKKDGDA